ncbi:heterokaryon incompatibility protein-domain-containing protein [Thelonectria olida]|uniref:Heterokaryon incompatibility protein-domain-containing protein n=1 Tax=Thelonectria olida TaxID=1576542 RepID=A0A9P9AI52_9HYPO|nr:heterokaryon incompatibility protein-domain-containing protein [Thelonectria olida]
MVRNIEIERALRRGVWCWGFFCLLSSAKSWIWIPAGSMAMVGLFVLPLFFLLARSPRSTKTGLAGRGVAPGLLLGALSSSYGFIMYGVTMLVLRRWDPLLVFAIVCGLVEMYSLSIYLLDRLQVNSRVIFGVMQQIEGLSTRLRGYISAASQVQNPFVRISMILVCGTTFALLLSSLLVLSTLGDFRRTALPWVRLRVREYWLKLRKQTFGLLWKECCAKYQHLPIEPNPDGKTPRIRLLRMLPRRPFGRTRCQLIDADLKDDVGYQAISYTWGEVNRTDAIYIDGKVLNVTPTVSAVLYHLSSYWSSQLVWIDSICIDQDDDGDKDSQIRLMREVYHKADKVVVWLDNVQEPWKVRTMLAGIWHEYMYGSTESCVEMIRTYSEEWAETGWMHLMNMFGHPWFLRVWVVQEIVMASSATVLASGEPLVWDHIATVAHMLFSPPFNLAMQQSGAPGVEDDSVRGLRHANLMGTLRNERDVYHRRLAMLLGDFSGFESSKDVDRLYGLLGLLQPAFAAQEWLRPNSSRPPEHLYTDVARNLIPTDCNDILSFAGIGYELKMPNLPSWAPDWSSLGARYSRPHHLFKMQHLARYSASAGSRLDVSFSTQPAPTRQAQASYSPPGSQQLMTSIMTIQGHCFDEICHVGPILKYGAHNRGEGGPLGEIFDVYVSHMRARKLAIQHARQPYPTGQPLYEVFWRCLLGDMQFERPAPSEVGLACQYWERLTAWAVWQRSREQRGQIDTQQLEELDNETNNIPSVEEIFALGRFEDGLRMSLTWNSARLCCVGRSFCVTRNGYMVLVPPKTAVGDLVCVFYGLEIPFIIRPRPGEGGAENRSVSLVGEAYVHGMMDGEAMDIPSTVAEHFDVI